MDAMMVSQALLWAVVICLSVVVLALARQIGVLHERIAPVGALTSDHGPEIGDPAPRLKVLTLDGREISIGGALAANNALLLLFVSPACPVCKKIVPLAKAFARSERLSVIFVGEGDLEEQRRMISRHGLDGFSYVISSEVGLAFRVGKLPYAVLLDERGVVAAKGLVNSREHLESLVVAKETGFASIQSYLGAAPTVAASGNVVAANVAD